MKKKHGLFVVMAIIITAICGCQKENLDVQQLSEEVQQQSALYDFYFEGLNEITFSVEDNLLVFENEEAFQKCIEYLANLGDENFPKFEEVIGFESYRKAYKDDVIKASVFADELYQTLLNPEMEIVIGNYLFREDPKDEKTHTFELKGERICDLESAAKYDFSFSWNDEAFAMLSGENPEPKLKSGCTGNHDHKKDWILQSGTYPAPVPNAAYAYKVEVKAKLCFQTTAIFKSLISKIKTESFTHEGMTVNGRLFTVKISQNIDYHYDRHNEDRFVGEWSHFKVTSASQDEVTWRPFYGTRKVNCYNVRSTFKWEVWANWLAPQYQGQYSAITFTEACNANGCPL